MRWWTLLLVALMLTAASAAWAAPKDDPRVTALKAQADAAMDAHHYDDAIAAYTQAYEIAADPALLYNRGRAHEARGEYPQALDDVEKFAEQAPPALRARVPALGELLAELRGRVATLELRCNVSGARVLVGGKEVGTTPLASVRLAAGKTVLEIVAPDQLPYKRDVELKGGATLAVDAVLSARPRGVVAPPVSPFVEVKPLAPPPVEGRSRSVFASPWFWTIAGVLVAGGAAVALGVAAGSERGADNGTGFVPGRVSGP